MTDMIEQFKNMTLGELTAFNRQFQETFDVVADDPVVYRHPPGDVLELDEDEPTAFTVTLVSAGEKRINVIKVVRELAKLGLKESKELVEAAPTAVLTNVDADTARAAKDALLMVGAEVNVKPAEESPE